MIFRNRRPGWRVGLLTAAGLFAGAGLVTAVSATGAPTAPPVSVPKAATPAPDSFADLIAAVKPAVVNISVRAAVTPTRLEGSGPQPFGPGSPFEDFFRRFGQPMPDGTPRMVQGSGSGFVVAADGYVVTNAHVVDGAQEVTVTFVDGTTRPAEVRGVDPKTDLAVLKIETDEALPWVEFGDSDAARVGDWVIAIGNPFGLGGTATTGIVSARGRDIQAGPFDDFLQIDAPINQGNSGGPLFDTTGKVIGINTAIYSPNGGSVGIGFAIPASLAAGIVELKVQVGSSADESPAAPRVAAHGKLGLSLAPLTDAERQRYGLADDVKGAVVAGVTPNSPAALKGLQAGDVIATVGRQPVASPDDVVREVAKAREANRPSVLLKIVRGTQSRYVALGLA